MASKDYYKILGISSVATADEIKSAYRKLTKVYHPDVNKDPKAEEQFKDLNEAHETLSDPIKRKAYDRNLRNPYKTASKPSTPNFTDYDIPFNDDYYRDMFKDIMNNQRPKAKPIDRDITLDLPVSFLEAALGTSKKINFNKKVACTDCKGSGSALASCFNCLGRKNVTTTKFIPGVGNIPIQTQCPTCLGTGQSNRCSGCQSSGYTDLHESLDIDIPAGVSEGTKLKVKTHGNSTKIGIGDLYLNLIVDAKHPQFKREGNNIYSKTKVSLKDILLGLEVDAETIHGPVKVTIPPGSQPNSKIKLSKRGVLGGDHILELNLTLPNKLTEQQKVLISQMDI
jgi:molecular chaperone DnaJ